MPLRLTVLSPYLVKVCQSVVEVELQETINCSPQSWLEFVMDVERYAEVDDKIEQIAWVRRKDQLVEFKFRPRLPGLPLPPVRMVSQMRLTSDSRIDVRLAPLPQNLSNRLVTRFRASFSCEPHDGGILATRAISFAFTPGIRRVIEPVLSRTLPPSVRRELCLTKKILEG